jgi:hypothetical protein
MNDLLANIKKKGANNVLPINAMATLDDDTSNNQASPDTSPDFYQGSS